MFVLKSTYRKAVAELSGQISRLVDPVNNTNNIIEYYWKKLRVLEDKLDNKVGIEVEVKEAKDRYNRWYDERGTEAYAKIDRAEKELANYKLQYDKDIEVLNARIADAAANIICLQENNIQLKEKLDKATAVCQSD